ncbi:unnamed protein product [Rhizophagus irregularis]|nr:unnamed protein product [Rhizophagus irregularis]
MESIVITKMMITKYEEFNKNSIQLPRLFAGGAKTTSIIAFFYENIIYRHGCPRELLRSSFCKRISLEILSEIESRNLATMMVSE